MPVIDAIWDLPDEPDGNRQHIAENGLTREDVEYVLNNSWRVLRSRSSGRPIVFGDTLDGERIAVVYDKIDDHTVYPVTAYRVEN